MQVEKMARLRIPFSSLLTLLVAAVCAKQARQDFSQSSLESEFDIYSKVLELSRLENHTTFDLDMLGFLSLCQAVKDTVLDPVQVQGPDALCVGFHLLRQCVGVPVCSGAGGPNAPHSM